MYAQSSITLPYDPLDLGELPRLLLHAHGGLLWAVVSSLRVVRQSPHSISSQALASGECPYFGVPKSKHVKYLGCLVIVARNLIQTRQTQAVPELQLS